MLPLSSCVVGAGHALYARVVLIASAFALRSKPLALYSVARLETCRGGRVEIIRRSTRSPLLSLGITAGPHAWSLDSLGLWPAVFSVGGRGRAVECCAGQVTSPEHVAKALRKATTLWTLLERYCDVSLVPIRCRHGAPHESVIQACGSVPPAVLLPRTLCRFARRALLEGYRREILGGRIRHGMMT